MGGVGGWLDTDNKTISVQLNLTGTATGTELGNTFGFSIFDLVELVEYILGLTEKVWFGTFWVSVFCSD